MSKPIIATTLAGLLLKHEPWDNAHVMWFKQRAKELKDESILKWAHEANYFKGVDEVMRRLYPNLSDAERTTKARESYFKAVLMYIEDNLEVRNEEVIKYFQMLKEKYLLALITTNTADATQKILQAANLTGFFDTLETSLPEEKDDKRLVFQRFLQTHEKPVLYLGGVKKDSYDFCKEQSIHCLAVNLESMENVTGVETLHTLDELKARLEKL